MPKTRVRDITKQAPVKSFTKSWGLVNTVYTLTNAWAGRFCFPAAGGYECGTKKKRTLKKGTTFSAGFSKAGVTINATASLEQTHEFEHTAGKCEACDPIICYSNSTLSVWSGATKWPGIGMYRSSKTLFDAGPWKLSPNCSPNPECVGCTKGKVKTSQSAALLGEESTFPTMLVATVLYDPPEGGLQNLDVQILELFIDEIFMPVPLTCAKPMTTFIAVGAGLDSLDDSAEQHPLSLVSEDGVDRSQGGLRVRNDGTVPILAIGSDVDATDAYALVTPICQSEGGVPKRVELRIDFARGYAVVWGHVTPDIGPSDSALLDIRVQLKTGNELSLCRVMYGSPESEEQTND